MTTARDVVHPDVECIGEYQNLVSAAQRMRELDVGALPICGVPHGIIIDQDIVLKRVAIGGDPNKVTAGELAQGKPITVEADTDVQQVLQAMEQHRIRRLPVIDQHRFVGLISEADLARHLPEETVGHFVEAICASP